MKKAIKRYNRIFVEYFLVALVAMVLSGIIQSSMAAQGEFRGEISKNALAIRVQDYHESIHSLYDVLAMESECTAIYKAFPYANAYAIWRRGSSAGHRMMEGSFFSTEQLQSAERYAVVGKNVYEGQVEIVDQMPVIYFDTLPYTVIGVLGYADRGSDYDNAFYINLSSLLANDKYAADGEYILDYESRSEERYERLVNQLKPYMDEETLITQIDLSKYIPSVTDVLRDDAVIEFLLLSMLMILVSSFSVTLEWIEKRKSEVEIRKQLGATTREILAYIFARMILISMAAYALALPLYTAEHSRIMRWLNYNDCAFNVFYSMATYGICAIVSFAGCVPAVSAIKRILPQAAMR